MSQTELYADVLLPLPLRDLYTYSIPVQFNDSIKEGQRVVVQFGKQKIYSALVYRIHQNPPHEYKAKEILSILDDAPLVNKIQYSFWEWIADYYMCTKGEVMNAALPSALKLASETKVTLSPNPGPNPNPNPNPNLNDKEYLICEALEIQKVLTISEVSKIVQLKNVVPLIKSLIEKGVVINEEQLSDNYKPKIVKYVRLTEEYKNEDKLKETFEKLENKAYKQLELLMLYLDLSKTYSDKPSEVRRSDLIDNPKASDAALNSLVKKGILEIYSKQISRLEQLSLALVCNECLNELELTKEQQIAFDEITNNFKKKDVVLLNGITSSGKTEIYVKLINEVQKQGKQILYLVPEIALTTQLIMRMQKYFGNTIGVYHSKFTKDERAEIWNNISGSDNKVFNIQHSTFNIIIGPRSAMFLPFSNLGLIIVDEEHDTGYKQHDTPPRYNARDAAIYLAKLHNAKTLLGSATPSIESYYNTETGKFSLVELNTRFGNIKLPEIIVVNIKEQFQTRKMRSHFSQVLLDSIRYALDNKEQVILFQNRRGFSLRLECQLCDWSPQCKNCDVTLIYHKQNNLMRCHYCGYTSEIPDTCPACHSSNLKMKGFGTEKIEDELPIFFPEAEIKRMDLDSTRTRNAYHQIINDFQDRRIDILVGTQMVTKGLDFDNVSVVGILNADNMLHFPDFRTFERSYQQLSQVSGRAGRKNKQGRVIVQTYNPNHPVIKFVYNHDYKGMYKSQVNDRFNYKYPPFYRLIKITLKHRSNDTLNKASADFAKMLKRIFGNRVLGPEAPLISRIKNFYLKEILIKIEKDTGIASYKSKLSEKLVFFSMTYKSVRVIIDVDPQ